MQTTTEKAGKKAGQLRSRLTATHSELMAAEALAVEQTMETFHKAARTAWDAANAALASAENAAQRAPRARLSRR